MAEGRIRCLSQASFCTRLDSAPRPSYILEEDCHLAIITSSLRRNKQKRRVITLTMEEIHSAPMQEAAQPQQTSERTTAPLQIPPPSLVALPPPSSASRIHNQHFPLDAFSPVNQNGSFEFDRVLKSGYVQKRTRKTKVGSCRPLRTRLFS